MKNQAIAVAALFCVALTTEAYAAPVVDSPAPLFTAQTSSGETIDLAALRGRTVVLEWTNDGCPFVQKHYQTGNMQATQRAVTESGGVWISVISSAPGKQGHADASRANDLTDLRNAAPTYVVLDPTGELGRIYAAKTTPQMAVIDPEGVLRYAGAMDDKPTADHASVSGAVNYTLAAFEAVTSGGVVAIKETKPYGCSVKYPG